MLRLLLCLFCCSLFPSADAQILWEQHLGVPYRQSSTQYVLEPNAEHLAVVREVPNEDGQIGVTVYWFDQQTFEPFDTTRLEAARGRDLRYGIARAGTDGELLLITYARNHAGDIHRWSLHRVRPSGAERLFSYNWSEAVPIFQAGALLPLSDGGFLITDHLLELGRLNQARVLRFDSKGNEIWATRFTDNSLDRNAWFRTLAHREPHVYIAGRRSSREFLIELDAATGASIREFPMGAGNGFPSLPNAINDLRVTTTGTVGYVGVRAGKSAVGTVDATGIHPQTEVLSGYPHGFLRTTPTDSDRPQLISSVNFSEEVLVRTFDEDFELVASESEGYHERTPTSKLDGWHKPGAFYGEFSGRIYQQGTVSPLLDTAEIVLYAYGPDESREPISSGWSQRSVHEDPHYLLQRGGHLYIAYRRGNSAYTPFDASGDTYDELLETDLRGNAARRVLSVPTFRNAPPARYEPLSEQSWLRLRAVEEDSQWLIVDYIDAEFHTRWTDTLPTRNQHTLTVEADAQTVTVRNLETAWQFDRASGHAEPPRDLGFNFFEPWKLPEIVPYGADHYLLPEITYSQFTGTAVFSLLNRQGAVVQTLEVPDAIIVNPSLQVFPFEEGAIVTFFDFDAFGGGFYTRLLRIGSDFSLLEINERNVNSAPLEVRFDNQPVRTPYGIWFDRDLFWWTADGTQSALPPQLAGRADVLPAEVPNEYWILDDIYRNNSRDLRLLRVRLPERVRDRYEGQRPTDPVVFPSPGRGLFRWRMDERSDPALRYRVIDARGVVVLDRLLSPAGEGPTVVLFELPGVAAGGYVLEVETQSGARRTVKFVVQGP